MTTTWISGTGITVSIGGDLTLQVTDISVGLAATAGSKPVLGQAYAGKVSTQGDGTFSASGETTVENIAALVGFRDPSSNPVAIIITWAGGGTEAFDLYITDLSTEAEGSGEATWSLSGDIDGSTYVYTPPV